LSENASHNKQGSKGYRDYIIGKLSVETLGKEASGNEELINKATESFTKDMAKLDEPASGTKGSSEIEHFENPHSFEHSFDPATLTQGNKTETKPKYAKEDIRDGHRGA
jgi:hypothetical protein